jgi:hypothetical protein
MVETFPGFWRLKGACSFIVQESQSNSWVSVRATSWKRCGQVIEMAFYQMTFLAVRTKVAVKEVGARAFYILTPCELAPGSRRIESFASRNNT